MIVKDKNDFYANRYMRHNKVTGSFTLYSVHLPNGENVRFFVDAGIKQGEDNIGFYNAFVPFNTEKISFGILTHAHMDGSYRYATCSGTSRTKLSCVY